MPPRKATASHPSANLLNFFTRSTHPTAASKRRKISASPRAGQGSGQGTDGSCPVVISDDEDDEEMDTQSSREKVRKQSLELTDFVADSAKEAPLPESNNLRHRTSSKSPTVSSRPAYGPIPPPSTPVQTFPGHPNVKPMSTWPTIISTTAAEQEDDFAAPDALEAPLPIPSTRSLAVTDSQNTSPITENLTALEDDWNEGDEEGMGMEDPDEDGVETGTEGETGSVNVIDVDLDVEINGGNKKRKGKEVEMESEDMQCPVCAKGFRKGQSEQLEMHVNICLDSSWTREVNNKREKLTLSSSSKISTLKEKEPQRPISSFCIPSPYNTEDEDEDLQEIEPPEKVSGPNAFSVLMSGHKENAEWKVAEIDLKRDGKRSVGRRKAPFYKVMTGMPIAVDAFRYGSIPGVKAYLLTHAHSDHYTNLSSNWKNGPIYCSETTANLIKHMLGVDAKWVHGLPWDTPIELSDTGGVTVTVIKANHCPGSSLFLFEGRQTLNAGDSVGFKSPYIGGKRVWRYLHCGDFRACPKHVLHPAIQGKKIDTVYLDTTYLNPRYCFPAQPQVINACAALARRTVLGFDNSAAPGVKLENGEEPDVKPFLEGEEQVDQQERGQRMMESWLVKDEEGVKAELDGGEEVVKKKGRTLVVMGTYSIGKERIVKGVARALNSKIYCDARKRSILLCEADPELHAMLTSDPLEASIHLVPLQTIQLDRLQPYLHQLRDTFDRVLAFRPTGWTYTPPAGSDTLPDINTVIRRDQKRNFTDAYLRPMRGSSRQFMMFGVPYSEHSSFFELTCFALSVPGPDVKMIATVNVGNEKSRGKMKKWFERWQAEKIKRQKAGLPAIVEYRDETYW